jgi:hypothetical protein
MKLYKMTTRTAKILAIYLHSSLSAIRETISTMTSEDDKTFGAIELILTAGFIWTAIYFWKMSKKTNL